jgi:phosphoglucomutase
LVPIKKILTQEGFSHLNIVDAQANEDGDFSTVESPNPEDKKALLMGIEQAKAADADLVLGTDPDCDRVGVAVKHHGEYVLLSGNQTGVLLLQYLLENKAAQFKKPAIIKTIATSELGTRLAKEYDVPAFQTLTGFKYIGEMITRFEQAKAKKDKERNYDFLFGYEESFGYLSGSHSRDKDGVVSSLLICEMAANAKSEGKTLIDKIEEIYARYGYYLDALDSFTFQGKNGKEKIRSIMNRLRQAGDLSDEISFCIDYSTGRESDLFGLLETSDVLKMVLKDGSWILVRPSGTEPKLKVYYDITGKNKKESRETLNALRKKMNSYFDME